MIALRLNVLLGIARYGEGSWELITISYNFGDRIPMDLKDKFRNMASKNEAELRNRIDQARREYNARQRKEAAGRQKRKRQQQLREAEQEEEEEEEPLAPRRSSTGGDGKQRKPQVVVSRRSLK